MPTRIHRKSILALAIASAAAAAGFTHPASASPILWSNTAGSDVWATGTNWIGGSAPAAGDIAEFDQIAYAAAGNAPNAGTTSVAGIQFGDGTTAAAAITVSGTQITIGGSGISQLAASAASGVNSSIVVGAAQTWSNSSANALTIGSVTGSIDTSAASAALSTTATGGMVINIGSGSTTFSSATASSTGAFTFNNTGSGAITITGALTLGAAALNVNGNLVIDGTASSTGATSLLSTTAAGAYGSIEYALGNAMQTLGSLSNANKGTLIIQSDVQAGGTAGLTFSLGGHTVGSALNFIIESGGTSNTIRLVGTANTNPGVIAGGAYLSLGSGADTTYAATVTGSDGAGYLTPFIGGTIAADVDAIGTAGVNYELSESGTDTITMTAHTGNTIHYTGTGLTVETNGNALTLNGVLNAGTGTLTFDTSTAGVGIGSTNELVLNAANANIEFTGQYNYAGTANQSITITGPHDVLFNQINNSGADTLTINGAANVSPLYVGSTQTLTFNTTGIGGIVVNSNIADNPAGASNVDITASSTGLVTFNGANTYTGATTIDNSILVVSALSLAGTPGNLGEGSSLVIGNGTLRYVGTTVTSTNVQLTIGDANGNNATLDNSAVYRDTAAPSFTNTAPVSFGQTGLHTLTFTGSQGAANYLADAGIFSPIITDSGSGAANATSVVMNAGASNGSPTAVAWELNGVNTYSGGTTISNGALVSNNASGFGTGLVTVTSTSSTVVGTAYLGGSSGTVYLNNFSIAGAGAVIQYNGSDISGGALTLTGGITVGTYSAAPGESSTITLNGDTEIAGVAPSATTIATIAGQITGNGVLTLGNASGVYSPIFVISNPYNDWVGDLSLVTGGVSSPSQRIVELGASNVIPAASNIIFSGSYATFTVNLSSFSDTVASLSSTVVSGPGADPLDRIVTNSIAGASVLTLSSDTGGSFIGTLSDSSTTASLSLVKSGNGTQTLAGTSTYHGNTTVNAGTLALDYTLYAGSSSTTVANYFTQNSATTLNGGTLAIVGRSDGLAETPTTTTDTPVKSSSMTLTSVAGLVVGQLVNADGVTAGTYISNINGNVITLSAITSATIDIPSGSSISIAAATGTTTTQNFKSLALTASSALEADGGPVTITTTGNTAIGATGDSRTLTLQGTGAGTLMPSITDGSANQTSLTKAGSGTWTLSNASNTYTGQTTITGGTLALAPTSGNNNIAGSSTIVVGQAAGSGAVLDVNNVSGGFHVVAGQTLAGFGTVSGAVTVDAGGHLAPGGSIGTLTVDNAVTLNGSSDFEINDDTGANDVLAGATNLVYGGVLNVTDLGDGGNYSGGQTFTLFTLGAGGTESGAFSAINLPTLPAGLTWETFGGQPFDYSAGLIEVEGSSVPEPASLALLGLGAAAMLMRRRRGA